jgi:hypothetical protein
MWLSELDPVDPILEELAREVRIRIADEIISFL